MTKTFLIIDDQGSMFEPRRMEKAFAAVGIDSEFRVASHHILEIIEEWKARGLSLDVVTCDINATFDNAGIQMLEYILDKVVQTIGSDMLPRQLFFHSADYHSQPVVTKYGTSPCVINDSELFSLQKTQGVYHDWDVTGRALRDYLNANWGARFVISRAEEKNLSDPEGPLNPGDAFELLECSAIKPEEALRRMELDTPDYFIDRIYVDLSAGDEEPCDLRFHGRVPGAVVGSLAFGTEDIVRIKEKSPAEPIILLLDSAEGYEVPPAGIDGVVVLRDDVHAAHIGQVCDNMGVPALIGVYPEYNNSNYSFSREEGLSFSNWGGEKSAALKAEDGVTLGANNYQGALYAGRMTLSEPDTYVGDLSRSLMLTADAFFEKSGIRIKANSDTAAQVDEAIAIGADGIGLARTEHMFFQPEKRALLREYLLSDAPAEGVMASFRDAQEADFCAILDAAQTADRAFPVTIRLLDAPPHEFMNANEAASFEARVGKGNTRGVQAGLRTKGLYEAQIAALCDAFGAASFPHALHILVPNVLAESEMEQVRDIFARHTRGSFITLSPMVEMKPYLQELAARPAMPYDAVSYGTSDLTSSFMDGVVRNDVPGIMAWMKDNGVHGKNPFLSLMDPVKAGIMTLQGRGDAPGATICGAHARDAESIRWAAENGISLSVPFRYVPYAKMVAGQALLKMG